MTSHRTRSVLFAGLALLLHAAAAQAVDSADCEQNGGVQYCEPKIYVWAGTSSAERISIRRSVTRRRQSCPWCSP